MNQKKQTLLKFNGLNTHSTNNAAERKENKMKRKKRYTRKKIKAFRVPSQLWHDHYSSGPRTPPLKTAHISLISAVQLTRQQSEEQTRPASLWKECIIIIEWTNICGRKGQCIEMLKTPGEWPRKLTNLRYFRA